MHRIKQLQFDTYEEGQWTVTDSVLVCIYCDQRFLSIEEAEEDGCEWIVPPDLPPTGIDAWWDTEQSRREKVWRYNDDKPARLVEVLIEPQEDPYEGFDQMNGNWGLKRRSITKFRWNQLRIKRSRRKIRDAFKNGRLNVHGN